MNRERPNRAAGRGFSLVETAATLAIVSILTAGMASVASSAMVMMQDEITSDRLRGLQRAILGDPVIVVNETRTAFGYVGDMGNLPTSLEDLWTKGTQPAFSFDTIKKTGAGWNGPYTQTDTVETLDSLMQDGYGNSLFYSPVPFTDPTFGADALGNNHAGAAATPTSNGANRRPVLPSQDNRSTYPWTQAEQFARVGR